uniref:Uncharacterized protein n=1 Tax=Glossina austeni TaxID=7395 RepID=A0A1A9VRI5_GLOAU
MATNQPKLIPSSLQRQCPPPLVPLDVNNGGATTAKLDERLKMGVCHAGRRRQTFTSTPLKCGWYLFGVYFSHSLFLMDSSDEYISVLLPTE